MEIFYLTKRFYYFIPYRYHGFYLIPTIHIWKSDFKKEDILPFVQWGVELKFMFWGTGFIYNQK